MTHQAASRVLEAGALYDAAAGSCRFFVWAPRARALELHLVEPQDQLIPMVREGDGEYRAEVEGIGPGARYWYRIDGERDRPDPASRLQPLGVHGPSEVVDRDFEWSAEASRFRAPPLADWIVYELHVGTFSREGTFDGAARHLDLLVDLGVNAVELLPVAQFPGTRNWGYDGVFPYAVQESYGGPAGLKRFVDACHRRGLAVVSDFVCNHLGPEGNYLSEFAPYFTDRYHTPWGEALNYDGRHSEWVRSFFLGAAMRLVEEFRIDALRVDAIHAITDTSARPFLQELCTEVRRCARAVGREAWVIAESDLNDARVLQSEETGGLGFDAQWADDFHHAVHATLTGERQGYYADFGDPHQLARSFFQPFLYQGQFSWYRGRRHGNSPHWFDGQHFVVCTQNHDQVGNRAVGDRHGVQLSFEEQKTLACMLLLSPYVPLLFMGQEYGETAPFPYFTHHGDAHLASAVREGRRAEFAAFGWEPEELPDPQAQATFDSARLDRSLLEKPSHRKLWELHRELMALRRRSPALNLNRCGCEAVLYHHERVVLLRRSSGQHELWAAFSLSNGASEFSFPLARGCWRKVIDTGSSSWLGPFAPAPGEIESEGALDLTLAPRATLAFERLP